MYDLKTIVGWKEHLVLYLNIDNIVNCNMEVLLPFYYHFQSYIPDNLLEESLQQIYSHTYLHIKDQSVSLFESHQHSSDQIKILKDQSAQTTT